MNKRYFHRVDEMFDMLSWTQQEEKVLINLLRRLKRDEILVRNELQGDALFGITSNRSIELGKDISVNKVAGQEIQSFKQ